MTLNTNDSSQTEPGDLFGKDLETISSINCESELNIVILNGRHGGHLEFSMKIN